MKMSEVWQKYFFDCKIVYVRRKKISLVCGNILARTYIATECLKTLLKYRFHV